MVDTPPHFKTSFTQHALSQVVVLPVQSVAVPFFMPAPQVCAEHFALTAQQSAFLVASAAVLPGFSEATL
jgi:hypothetical protein